MYAGSIAKPQGLNAAASPAPNAKPSGAMTLRPPSCRAAPPERDSTKKLMPSMSLSPRTIEGADDCDRERDGRCRLWAG